MDPFNKEVQIMNPLLVKGFRRIRVFAVAFIRNTRIYPPELKYFGVVWRGIKAKKPVKCAFYRLLRVFERLVADRTGLEPATSAVTGRHSNQLNYRSKLLTMLSKLNNFQDGKDSHAIFCNQNLFYYLSTDNQPFRRKIQIVI